MTDQERHLFNRTHAKAVWIERGRRAVAYMGGQLIVDDNAPATAWVEQTAPASTFVEQTMSATPHAEQSLTQSAWHKREGNPLSPNFDASKGD